ncbi:UDP-N-acetyl-D-mannosaminuronic acid dehydrogenase [Arcanobacterium pluranimalium]|uniref:UDP-N-acetyl-D-mannosamine dehydrogenase n=1 Tax=Arcanobacterium pluranimalium TaxID=108028 RepID=UPI00195C327F|nr:UDP-N-acetyl-D-mannosamine dehydrogenase [Arcanobacterium pluranimalium]MBM7824604.1 UDP-N-acetyl-D-mannosaminuronic acid dehydrogenase [Arcanobacterium pluranimalium]
MNNNIVVVGLGYIGLPTAVTLAQSGWIVTGVDVSDRTIDFVSRGELPFVEDGLASALASVVNDGSLRVQKHTPPAEIYIIAVPTPFKGDHELDSSFIDSAVDAIIPQLRGDELVILESTSPPGTTEYVANRIFAARPDLSIDGKKETSIVHFAHAPERVLPGRIMIEMRSNDRIIGGITPAATEYAAKVYRTFTEGEVLTTNARTAEMAKLTENAFRDVNIAFANELSILADEQDIDVWELIALANRHPRVNILNPGPGVGGHCIAVDPWFMVSSSPKNAKLIKTARLVNDAKPHWVLSKLANLVSDNEVTHASISEQAQQAIALFGLAFKANIDDLRESPAVKIAHDVAQRYPNHRILLVEPYISDLPKQLQEIPNVELVSTHDAVARAHIMVALVAHSQFTDLNKTFSPDQKILDTIGIWRDQDEECE